MVSRGSNFTNTCLANYRRTHSLLYHRDRGTNFEVGGGGGGQKIFQAAQFVQWNKSSLRRPKMSTAVSHPSPPLPRLRSPCSTPDINIMEILEVLLPWCHWRPNFPSPIYTREKPPWYQWTGQGWLTILPWFSMHGGKGCSPSTFSAFIISNVLIQGKSSVYFNAVATQRYRSLSSVNVFNSTWVVAVHITFYPGAWENSEKSRDLVTCISGNFCRRWVFCSREFICPLC